MNKDTIKAFILWLESASIEEIKERRETFLATGKNLSSPEAKSDIRLGLRLIDEELLARLEADRVHCKQ